MKVVNSDFSWKLLSSLGFILFASNSALYADEQSDLFAKLDKNSDGVLEAGELGADQKSIFARLLREADSDEDGKINLQEFKLATTPAPKQPFESVMGKKQNRRGPAGRGNFDPDRLFGFLDTNNDGKLTRSELPDRAKERAGKIFDKLGKDEISKEEFFAAARKFRPQAAPGKKPGKRPGQKPGPKPGQAGDKQVTEFFKRFDKNSDGKVTMSEVPEKLRPRIMKIFQQSGKSPQEGITQVDLKKYGSKRPGNKNRPFQRKPKKKT